MKKLILSAIACFIIVLSSCNQNSPSPSPATPATPTPTPTTSMTTTEAALVGDWIWDKTENYTSGNLTSIHTPATLQFATGAPTSYTLYAGSHMVLKSSLYNGSASTPQYYNADFYSGSAISSAWGVIANANGLQLNANWGIMYGGYIITLTANTLICHAWITGGIANGAKCYYHK
jgi:hypothetical protein